MKKFVDDQLLKGVHQSDIWPHVVNLIDESFAIELLPKPWPMKTGQPKSIPNHGPGTELKKLLIELGITTREDCGCNNHIAVMNLWNISGCITHKKEIISWLKESATWSDYINGILAYRRIDFDFEILNPFESIVNEAMRRAQIR